jgi:AraC-like DNA-binding protein
MVDVLADVLAAVRTGQPRSVRTEVHAPWGLRFTGVAGAGFHVVLQGACWLLTPHRPPLALTAGDVVFVRYRDVHALANDPATPLVETTPLQLAAAEPTGQFQLDGPGARTVLLCGAYLFAQIRSHPLLAALPEVIYLPAQLGKHPSLRAAVTLLGSEINTGEPGAAAVVPALNDALLIYILRAWLAEQPDSGWAAALSDPIIAPALQSIHAEPRRAWTVAALGAQAGLSRAAFARRFTTLTGQPPLTYLTHWRMTLAARLLRDSDASLRAIGRQIGYDSPYAFAKAFKRWNGLAPGQYRGGHRPSGG